MGLAANDGTLEHLRLVDASDFRDRDFDRFTGNSEKNQPAFGQRDDAVVADAWVIRCGRASIAGLLRRAEHVFRLGFRGQSALQISACSAAIFMELPRSRCRDT
jgi:hypothetical protein